MFIFGHLAVIEFQMCCRVPNFTKIKWFLFRYGDLTIWNVVGIRQEGIKSLATCCDSPHRPTYGMFLHLFTYLLTFSVTTKLTGSLSRLHSADEDAVSWLTSYGSWHAYEKKKCVIRELLYWHTGQFEDKISTGWEVEKYLMKSRTADCSGAGSCPGLSWRKDQKKTSLLLLSHWKNGRDHLDVLGLLGWRQS